jgi:hypothetical protein
MFLRLLLLVLLLQVLPKDLLGDFRLPPLCFHLPYSLLSCHQGRTACGQSTHRVPPPSDQAPHNRNIGSTSTHARSNLVFQTCGEKLGTLPASSARPMSSYSTISLETVMLVVRWSRC